MCAANGSTLFRSIGNIKPVADRWTADTGIEIKYIEVPLGEIDQKVLLESVSKTGSFDIALPATFGIPDLAESGILVNLDIYFQTTTLMNTLIMLFMAVSGVSAW